MARLHNNLPVNVTSDSTFPEIHAPAEAARAPARPCVPPADSAPEHVSELQGVRLEWRRYSREAGGSIWVVRALGRTLALPDDGRPWADLAADPGVALSLRELVGMAKRDAEFDPQPALVVIAQGSLADDAPCKRNVADLTPEERQKLAEIKTPDDIQSVSVADVWIDDHQPCVGVRLNGVDVAFCWLRAYTVGAFFFDDSPRAKQVIYEALRDALEWAEVGYE